jgi:ribosomal protein L37AE/L43A
MAKSKLATPDWIREGFDSKADWEKSHGGGKKKKNTEEKTFKVKKCPKCGSYNVNVVLSEQEGSDDDKDLESSKKVVGEWECKKCGWTGKNIEEDELTEDEFMKYLDEKGEEVA